jgi:hypothetical protein
MVRISVKARAATAHRRDFYSSGERFCEPTPGLWVISNLEKTKKQAAVSISVNHGGNLCEIS